MMNRGPGAHEPEMIIERVKAGVPFDQAVAEVGAIRGFKCEQWWIDLNRSIITEAYAPKPEAPKKKEK
jgi:hypothetical protein